MYLSKGPRVTVLPSNASDARHRICFHHRLITLTISGGAIGKLYGQKAKIIYQETEYT